MSARFLIDEDLPRSTGEVLRSHRLEPLDVRDIGLRGAKDDKIADHAKKEELCIVTGDFDFADVRSYPPSQHFGIIVLNPQVKNATARHFTELLDQFLKQQKALLEQLEGKLVIVQPNRVRVRDNP